MHLVARSLALVACAIAAASFTPRARAPLPPRVQSMSFPIAFEPNRGQADAGVDFVSRAPGCTVLLEEGDATLVASEASSNTTSSSQPGPIRR